MASGTTSDILLSIVIPTYNYAAYLGRCLSSVLPQLTQGSELIVVDDGSTDNTHEVIGAFAAQDANLRYVRQENFGAAAARNHGVCLAEGIFVLFLDADDEMLPGTLDAIIGHLCSHPDTDLLVGGQISHRIDGKEKLSLPRCFPDDQCGRIADYLIHKRIDLGHGSFVARRELLSRCPYPETLRKREDIPVFAYLLAMARITTLELPMVRVHKHADSLRNRDFGEAGHLDEFIAEVFRCLPESCQGLRGSYAALRFQSAFRNALARRRWREACQYLTESLRQDWHIVLSPRQVRKGLRALMAGHD